MEQDTAINQAPTNEVQTTPKQSNFLATLLSILLLISCLIAGFFAYQTQNLVKELTVYKLQQEEAPIATPTLDPTTDWKTYDHKLFTIKYPNEYVSSSIGFKSPLNPNRNQKDSTLQDGELKIEFYTEELKDKNMTVESCYYEHSSENSTVLSKRSVNILGRSYETILWQGLGTGEFTCLEYANTKIIINKYPAETTRQNEYYEILSTFKFIEPEASTSPLPVDCTMEAKICPDGSAVGRSGPKCEFEACPTPKP